jgi:NAD-dependent SIR2 family protein deacetylase
LTEASSFARAAALLAAADALLVTAGAGMGVDSGLPDFRGTEGFWRAYPALAAARFDFTSIASPAAFRAQPALAWGFYGHRLALYRRTVPHAGFDWVRQWGLRKPRGLFVFTSNVDGQFQRAGFDPARIHECHGSIHRLQCSRPCSDTLWDADSFAPDVDESRCLLTNAAPTCPRCGALARPNVLMFGDGAWVERRANEQAARLESWLDSVQHPVVIEIGAGTAIPSVRYFGEQVARRFEAGLVRINPRDGAVPGPRHVSLPFGALAGLGGIRDEEAEA